MRPDKYSQRLSVLSTRLKGWYEHVVPGGVIVGGDMVGTISQERPRVRPLSKDGGREFHHPLPPRFPEWVVAGVGVALGAGGHSRVPLAGDQHERGGDPGVEGGKSCTLCASLRSFGGAAFVPS